jgi:hypothetical protein
MKRKMANIPNSIANAGRVHTGFIVLWKNRTPTKITISKGADFNAIDNSSKAVEL